MKEHAPAIDFNNLGQHFICADCMDGMKQFPDKFFDLAVVDPPYGINISKKVTYGIRKNDNAPITKYKVKYWDAYPPDSSYFDELFRVSQNQIIFGGNYFILPPTRGFAVWDKCRAHDISFSMAEYIWTSFNKPSLIFKMPSQGEGGNTGLKVLRRIHPTQKPVKLYQWLLKHFAKAGDKILDTHVGSGSSLIAFHRGGFDFIGFEIDEEYYAGAMERLNIEKLQGDLFMKSKTFA
jgi:site-specific DNA-methyltransferase (adenine-specific)